MELTEILKHIAHIVERVGEIGLEGEALFQILSRLIPARGFEMDLTDGVNSVFELLDEAFLTTVAARFAEMNKDFKETYYRYNY